MSINLVIEDIGVRDAGKGIARITEKKMQELGLEPYDVVEICGQRKSAIRAVSYTHLTLPTTPYV